MKEAKITSEQRGTLSTDVKDVFSSVTGASPGKELQIQTGFVSVLVSLTQLLIYRNEEGIQ